jgi:hypothetical protein
MSPIIQIKQKPLRISLVSLVPLSQVSFKKIDLEYRLTARLTGPRLRSYYKDIAAVPNGVRMIHT